MRFRAWTVMVLLSALVVSAGVARAETTESGISGLTRSRTDIENTIYAAVEYFSWKEFSDGSSQLLKETGPRYGIGFTRDYIRENMTFRPRLEIYGGKVDYDGQTQDGTPVKTDTVYTGFKAEADVGGVARFGNGFALEPFLGLGYDWWKRDIKSTGGAQGYTETWDSIYFRGGLRAEYPVRSLSLGAFGMVGVRWPFATHNRADVPGFKEVTLKPANDPGLIAEAGARYRSFKGTLYYESLRFDKSNADVTPIDQTTALFIWQPRSKADIVGVRLGYMF